MPAVTRWPMSLMIGVKTSGRKGASIAFEETTETGRVAKATGTRQSGTLEGRAALSTCNASRAFVTHVFVHQGSELLGHYKLCYVQMYLSMTS